MEATGVVKDGTLHLSVWICISFFPFLHLSHFSPCLPLSLSYSFPLSLSLSTFSHSVSLSLTCSLYYSNLPSPFLSLTSYFHASF